MCSLYGQGTLRGYEGREGHAEGSQGQSLVNTSCTKISLTCFQSFPSGQTKEQGMTPIALVSRRKCEEGASFQAVLTVAG